jgi:glycosyltransferase involved in cell wall biosynthesis
MNVIIINSLFPPNVIGGAEKSVALLAQAVAKRGHNVHVMTLARDAATGTYRYGAVAVGPVALQNLYWPFEKERSYSAVSKLRWHLRDGWNTRYSATFRDLVDHFQPDVIHTNNLTGLSTELWKQARHLGVRTVHTLRDYSLLCSRAALFKNGKDCDRRCASCTLLTLRKKSLSSRVDCVASNSRYVIDAHVNHGYFQNVPSNVIFNIADFPKTNLTQHVRRMDELVFGFIGRIEPEKGIEIVLEATQKLASTGWRLRIAGAGRDDYIAGLRSRYRSDRIEWLDFVTPDTFYSSIDTCLIASTWPEPLPRTLIESFAYGRSVICSDAGGIPEIASLGPVSLSYSRYSSDALAEAMQRAISEVSCWRRSGGPSSETMRLFSEQVIAERYLSLYRDD